MTMQELKIFEEKQIRTVWDEVQEKWYFCIIDIVQILTESKDYHTARKYWNKLKQRLVSEGNETVTNCPPHETIEFWIAFTNLFEVICRIFTIRQYCNNVINTEIPLFLHLIPDRPDLLLFKNL